MTKQIIIISGFSGVGKGTLLKRVLNLLPNVELIRSCTTRPKRNDTDFYTFISEDEFRTRISENAFLEYNCYSGAFYGTPASEVSRVCNEGKLPIAEIDPNGLLQIIQSEYFDRSQIHSVFIVDFADSLLQKLLGRNTESNEKIISRLKSAIEESKMIAHYDRLILNQDLEKATHELYSFITTQNCSSLQFDDVQFRNRLHEVLAKLSMESDI